MAEAENKIELTQEQLAEMLEQAATKAAESAARVIAEAQQQKEPEKPVVEETKDADKDENDRIGEALNRMSVMETDLRKAKDEARVAKALAESTISEISKRRITDVFAELSGRRPFDDKELEIAIEEAKNYEAALESQYAGARSVGTRDIHMGDTAHEQMVKALEGFFEQRDIDGVKRFTDLREAYCRWLGIDFFQLNPLQMMRDYSTRYDSELDHMKLQESLTTSSWGNLFADTMFKKMVKEFVALPYSTAWRRIVSDIDRVNDFRVQSWNRVGGYGNLTTVAEGQTYPQLTSPSDERVQYQVSKFGGIEDVTWEATLTDDLNRIRRIPMEMALAASRTLYQFVMNLVTTDNPTLDYDSTALYHANHANTDTQALSLAGLNVTQQSMRNQTRFGASDPLGPLNLPATLIVPNELEMRALRVVSPSDAYYANMADSATVASNSDTGTGIDPQAFKGRGIQVLVNDFLTDATDWFAVADASKVSTMVIGFLNGREEPELFVQDSPTVGSVFTADKISYKIRYVFGGDILEHRSFFRNVVA